MESNKIAMVTDDVARTRTAAFLTANAPIAANAPLAGAGAFGAYGFAVRVMPPVAVQGPGESSALRTNGTTISRSGHLPWSPPV